MNKIRISVTELAQFICRTGDLDFGSVAGLSARDGQKAHQRVQASSTDDNEVSVRSSFDVNDYRVSLGGRIDLLDKSMRRITEIKSTVVPAEFVSESQRSLHRAQVRLYAFCLQHEVNPNGADKLISEESTSKDSHSNNESVFDEVWILDVLYINIRNDTTTTESEELSCDEINRYGHDILKRYVEWMQLVDHHKNACLASAKNLKFPYPDFRAGQRALASLVYKGSRDSFNSLCEAPTGVGKTISTLFPAVKSLGEENIKQIVYLTAKTSGITAVSDALSRMMDSGLTIHSVTLRSKQLTCFCSNGGCERDADGRCPLTIGFYDRLPEARAKLLSLGVITPATMDDISWEYQLCPFELAIQMLPWMMIVVADYNYVFDPLVRLPWFSESRKSSLVLVDEAHNLPDRSRSMFSAKLDRYMGRSLIPLLSGQHKQLIPKIEAVDKALLKHARGLELGETIARDTPKGMRVSVNAAIELLLQAMSEGPALPTEASDWFRALCRYAAISDLYGESHRTITEVTKKGGKKDVRLTLLCLDASKELGKLYKYYKSVCFFSATLSPFSFYNAVLGAEDDAKWARLESPFKQHQSAHLLIPSIDTRYRYREQSLPQLVELVNDVASAKPGNYLVFLPSFHYLEQLWAAYIQRFPNQAVWKQAQGQTKQDHQSMLEAMQTAESRIGFVILGGVFGEGIDYVGDRLIGAVVVGLGLPGVNAEQQLMAEHFRENGYDGYDYANRIPGFTRVLQTIGRVIRTESDRGVVALVDGRFRDSFYRANFPAHIQPKQCSNQQAWREALKVFWSAA